MSLGSIHLTSGTICKAEIRCPMDDHVDTMEDFFKNHGVDVSLAQECYHETGDAKLAVDLARNPTELTNTLRKTSANSFKGEFANNSYYGDVKPREIQPEAMNGVIEALEEDDATQLVAACGTGKSYMGRQIIAHQLASEDANGIAIVLTSSIKLAHDTAEDLRPDSIGRYDKSLGEYGEDYVVIEVHSDSKGFMKNGTVSEEKIKKAWSDALAQGKKVVVISTYDSSSKVQKVQEALESEGVSSRADLLMNDEAHNILGQQRSASASTEGINTGYRSFHDEIPGAIQSKKRLYATATPVIVESTSDDPSAIHGATSEDEALNETHRVNSMRAQAAKMDKDPKARITIYSDDAAIVGKVGGYISQEAAIDANYLAKPDYQLRAALVQGDSSHQYVNIHGEYVSSKNFENSSESPMTPQTYAAVNATLAAMAADPEAGKNPSHNALAYCGSIEQAKAYRDNMKTIALAHSDGMSLSDAQVNVDSTDANVKRQARMRLLAEHVDVHAAYSGDDAEAKVARKKAFSMFKGNAITEAEAGGWNPHKRALANVDIFSEGVSISEIDTVVVSDDSKTTERAMTQAIGRSIRTVAGNSYKNTGHIIIPQVVNENGDEVNGGSVAIAAYGATRVERGVAAKKLQGVPPVKDEATAVRKYDAHGNFVNSELASEISGKHLTSIDDVVTAHNLERAHMQLLMEERKSNIPETQKYKNLSLKEQYARVSSYVNEKAANPLEKDTSWVASSKRIAGRNHNDLNSLRQSNKVLTSSLGAGDIGSIPESITKGLVRNGVLFDNASGSSSKNEPTLDEKRAFLLANNSLITRSLSDGGVEKTSPILHHMATDGIGSKELRQAYKANRGLLIRKSESNVSSLVEDNDAFTEQLFEYVNEKRVAAKKVSSLHDAEAGGSFQNGLKGLFDKVAGRTASKAVKGESMFGVNGDAIQSTGLLKASVLKNMAD